MPRNTSGLKRGGPGRPKGAKNTVPGDFKASIRRVYEEVASSDPDTTLNVYTQVLDGSLRTAVETIGTELFTIVHSPPGASALIH